MKCCSEFEVFAWVLHWCTLGRAYSKPLLGATMAPNLVPWVFQKIFSLEMVKNDICLEAKGPRVNMRKTKIVVSGVDLQTLKDSGVCRKVAGSYSIYCTGCLHWVHKKCSCIIGGLKPNPDYCCIRCKEYIDGSLITNGYLCKIKNWKLLIHFVVIGAGGSCDLTVITSVRSAWGKFLELLPILTCALSCTTRGQTYSTYIHPVLLCASECWAPSVNGMLKLECNDCAMVRWICNVRLKDHISSDSLLEKLGINNIQTLLQYSWLHCFVHIARNDGCVNSITALEVDGHPGRGSPRKTWRDAINDDCKNWKLTRVEPANNWMEKEIQQTWGHAMQSK